MRVFPMMMLLVLLGLPGIAVAGHYATATWDWDLAPESPYVEGGYPCVVDGFRRAYSVFISGSATGLGGSGTCTAHIEAFNACEYDWQAPPNDGPWLSSAQSGDTYDAHANGTGTKQWVPDPGEDIDTDPPSSAQASASGSVSVTLSASCEDEEPCEAEASAAASSGACGAVTVEPDEGTDPTSVHAEWDGDTSPTPFSDSDIFINASTTVEGAGSIPVGGTSSASVSASRTSDAALRTEDHATAEGSASITISF